MPLRLLLPNIRIHHARYIFHPVASLRLRCSIIHAIIECVALVSTRFSTRDTDPFIATSSSEEREREFSTNRSSYSYKNENSLEDCKTFNDELAKTEGN